MIYGRELFYPTYCYCTHEASYYTVDIYCDCTHICTSFPGTICECSMSMFYKVTMYFWINYDMYQTKNKTKWSTCLFKLLCHKYLLNKLGMKRNKVAVVDKFTEFTEWKSCVVLFHSFVDVYFSNFFICLWAEKRYNVFQESPRKKHSFPLFHYLLWSYNHWLRTGLHACWVY